ncbi:MAG: HAD hydrolase-like protein [Lachnospiraceae bacterium]|nr:HAD hydrolase-like protein [Lachnospiraceae bacterium]
MKDYQAILFDLDGTMLNTSIGVMESVEYTIETLGYRKLPTEALRRFVGPPIQDSFIREYGVDKEEAQRGANVFREYYKNQGLLKAEPYDNLYDLFELLKNQGKKIAVATYKRHDYAMQILEHFKISQYCDSMNGADNNNVLTKADIVEKCIKECSVTDKSKVVLIGDSEYDAIGAEGGGIDFIGVTYGFGFKTKADVAEYNHVLAADSIMEVMEFFK